MSKNTAITMTEENRKLLKGGGVLYVPCDDPDAFGAKRLVVLAENLDPTCMTLLSDFLDSYAKRSGVAAKLSFIAKSNDPDRSARPQIVPLPMPQNASRETTAKSMAGEDFIKKMNTKDSKKSAQEAPKDTNWLKDSKE